MASWEQMRALLIKSLSGEALSHMDEMIDKELCNGSPGGGRNGLSKSLQINN